MKANVIVTIKVDYEAYSENYNIYDAEGNVTENKVSSKEEFLDAIRTELDFTDLESIISFDEGAEVTNVEINVIKDEETH